MTAETYDESTGMCPNCVTPWKCNGPHELPPEPPRVVISVALEGFPPLPNATRRQNYHARSDEAATWRASAYFKGLQALRETEYPKDFPLKRAVLELVVIRPDERGPDLDNAVAAFKPVIDGIVDSGILKSDARSCLVGLSVVYETGPVGLRVDVLMGSAA